jgi:hypothetical protein
MNIRDYRMKGFAGILLLGVVVAGFSSTLFQQNPPRQSPAPVQRQAAGAKESQAWAAWWAFHSGLSAFAQRSPEGVRKMLLSRFQLTPAEAAFLLDQGQQFLRQIEQLDAEAREYVRARYKPAQPPPRGRDRLPDPDRRPAQRQSALEATFQGRRIFVPTDIPDVDSTIREYAKQVESRKAAVATGHVSALRARLSIRSFTEVERWVSTIAAASALRFERPTQPTNKIPSGPEGRGPLQPVRRRP